jgi:hypothetical protein
MLRRFQSTTNHVKSTQINSIRTIFAGPGGISSQGGANNNTLAGGGGSKRGGAFSTRNEAEQPNDFTRDPRHFKTTDPFKQGDPGYNRTFAPDTAQNQQQNSKLPKDKRGGGMMFYEEKDSPEFKDPEFLAKEEEKRKPHVQSTTERRVHGIRGAGEHLVDEEERARMRQFENVLEEEFQYLNKKAEEREKAHAKRAPGRTLKGSMVEARRKAQETYDYYQMNPDETISRPALYACVSLIIGIYLFMESGKDVNGPLWAGPQPNAEKGISSWDVVVPSSPSTSEQNSNIVPESVVPKDIIVKRRQLQLSLIGEKKVD